ncbi:efflux RND transporter periplasmic adaptor subunit [Flavobacterium sp. JP2137]|uniref:efflux RND transporter periplasmic adaptor subunit n=1 Tax=Flavobacterium sp. JP2137 TaxID=3414510 RepID=UPI003D2FB835
MKKYFLVPLIAVLVLMGSCQKKGEDTPAENTAEQHEEAATTIKEVELNPAQFAGAGIALGELSMKNLNEVIKVNGYTKLPPQNQADVSTFIPGIVTRILVNEGQYVKKGQLLAQAESTEFAKLQEEYAISKSTINYLQLEYDRQSKLREENVNSEKTFQKTQSELEIEKAKYRSLKKQLTIMNAGDQTAEQSLSIIAPIAGYIATINIKIGSQTAQQQPLFTLVDNSKLHLDLMVYEKDLPQIKIGQKVVFNLTNRDNTEIQGKIFSIGKSFENETKTIAVHADIENQHENLIPGMYVNALIHSGKQQLTALPKEAFVRADGREFVFVLEADETGSATTPPKEYHFQRIEVKTGVSELDYTQVSFLQELPKNAKIVTAGAYYLQSHLIKNESGGGGHDH